MDTEDNVFNIGDRVKCLVDHPEDNLTLVAGCLGTVCSNEVVGRVAVRWDEEIEGGHNCNGFCDDGYGWWIDRESIALYEEPDDDLYLFDEQGFNALLGIR